MKFLCVSCDEQMRLVETIPPAPDGSVSVVFACPTCSHRIGMLANPWETQVVSSLGVRIGGGTVAEAFPDRSPSEPPAESEDRLSKCPFTDAVRQMAVPEPHPAESTVWTKEAFVRLQNIPEFVRPMAKQSIEGYAKSHGYQCVDEEVLEQARAVFGM